VIHREWKEQETDNAFLRHALPLDAYYTAIDHGNLRNGKGKEAGMRAGAARKRRGVKAGIPDWLIVWHGITLWIERKAGSSLSDDQKTTRDQLVANGHIWRLAKSLDDVEAACLFAGIPLRATAGGIADRVEAARERKAPARKARRPKAEPRFTLGKRASSRLAKAGIFT